LAQGFCEFQTLQEGGSLEVLQENNFFGAKEKQKQGGIKQSFSSV